MPRLLLKIELVEHREQRYPTAGDWQIDEDGAIVISVSNTGKLRDALLIGMHEAVESILCVEHHVEQEDVDEFDVKFARTHDLSVEEPGASPDAPYFEEHAVADVVERLLALHLGVAWKEYSKRVDDLFVEGVKCAS